MKKIMKFLINWLDSTIMHLPAAFFVIAVAFSIAVPKAVLAEWEGTAPEDVVIFIFKTMSPFALIWGFFSAYFGRIKGYFSGMGHWAFEIMFFILVLRGFFAYGEREGIGFVGALLHGTPLHICLFWCIYAAISEVSRYKYKECRRKNRHKIKKEQTVLQVLRDVSHALSIYDSKMTKEFLRKFSEKRTQKVSQAVKTPKTVSESVKRNSSNVDTRTTQQQTKTKKQAEQKKPSTQNLPSEYRNISVALHQMGYAVFALKNNFLLIVANKQCCIIKCITKTGKYLFRDDVWYCGEKRIAHIGKDLQSVAAKLRAQCGVEKTFGLIAKCFKGGQVAGKSGYKIMDTTGGTDVLTASVKKHIPISVSNSKEVIKTTDNVRNAFRDAIIGEEV